MKHRVGTYREAGREARWSKTRSGTPMILIRDPNGADEHQRKKWWLVNDSMFQDMKKIGIREAFDSHTILGAIFSIPVR